MGRGDHGAMRFQISRHFLVLAVLSLQTADDVPFELVASRRELTFVTL